MPQSNKGTRQIIYLDRENDSSQEFCSVLGQYGQIHPCHDLQTAISLIRENDNPLALLDTATLKESPTGPVKQLAEFRGRVPMGLVTGQELENYVDDLRRWGILQVAVKNNSAVPWEIEYFLRAVQNPSAGFGLINWLHSTIQMYSISVNSMPTKTRAVERVINHFATFGFDVHELYEVRLILEEIANNAFFHAFLDDSGEEKYNIADFHRLEPEENVRIEYGSDATYVGFSVSDSAGSLTVDTILKKLERQFNQQGVFDVSGRGLYIARLLTSKLILNIEENERTQIIALFDQKRRKSEIKPFMINYSGSDWYLENNGE